MARAGKKLGGCIVASVTPMKKTGAIDYLAYKRLINWFIDKGINGICTVGTTGESATLSPKEHMKMIAQTVENVDGRVPVIAGTGANSTAEAVELTRQACADGADYCLSVVPYYNRPPQGGMRRHFEKIADESSKPIILYNVPSRTVADLADETVGKLAAHANIIGIKDATGDICRLHRIRELTGKDFILLSGDDSSARVYLTNGGHGVISVSANVAPQTMSSMVAAAISGKAKQALELDNLLAPFNAVQGIEANPIPAKWALKVAGRIGPGIRLPLAELSPEHRHTVVRASRLPGLA